MIKFSQVVKKYHAKANLFSTLSFSIERGAWVYLRGNSGEGKTSLLKLIAGMALPDSGAIEVDGFDITKMRLAHLPYFRRRIGFVFQEYALLDDVSVLKNVMRPLLIEGIGVAAAKERALVALKMVQSESLAYERPRYLSGGQQQLISIARAIVNHPEIIIADEPTANLDRNNALKIIELLQTFHAGGTTCLISTHDQFPEKGFEKNYELVNGQIVDHGNSAHSSKEPSVEFDNTLSAFIDSASPQGANPPVLNPLSDAFDPESSSTE